MRLASRFAVLCCLVSLVNAGAAVASGVPIGGRVEVDGQPAAKARIVLEPDLGHHARVEGWWTMGSAAAPVAETHSDKQGRFELEAPAVGFYKVRVELAGHLTQELGLAPLLHAIELPIVELLPDTGWEVRVTAGGEPVAARVVAFPIDPVMSRTVGRQVRLMRHDGGFSRPTAVVSTEAGGLVRLPASGDEKAWVLEASGEGFVPLRYEGEGRPGRLELELDAGVRRQVVAVDERGRPLPDVWLFFEEGELPLARTDATGHANLVAPTDEALQLIASDAAGRTGRVTLEPVDPSVDAPAVEVPMQAPRVASGTVVDQTTREPVADAWVWSGSPPATVTDARGAFAHPIPLAGPDGPRRIFLNAVAAGYGTSIERLSADETLEAMIALQPAASLSGRVVDADGSGLAGVEIGMTAKGRPSARRARLSRFAPRGSRTGDDGRFRLHSVVAGQSYELQLTKSGFAPATLAVDGLEPFEERSGLRAVLQRGRRAVGQVVDEGERPIVGATVRLEPGTQPRGLSFSLAEAVQEPEHLSGAEGRFEVPDLAAGRYQLTVRAPGFGSVSVPGIEIPQGAGDVDVGTVVLPPGLTVEGKVVDGGGQPVGGIEIRRTEPSRFPLPASIVRMMAARLPVDATSAADGAFVLGDLRQGERFDLSFIGDGYVAKTLPGVVAPMDEPLRIELQVVARITGRVVDDRGDPIAGARVEGRPQGLGGSGGGRIPSLNRARSDAEGRFELSNVEPGLLTLVASAEGFRQTQLSGLETVAGEELAEVELTLRPGAVIKGTVVDADGQPVAGVAVRITETGARRTEEFAETDGAGRFELTEVGLGPRILEATGEGSRRATLSLEVEAGTQTVELRFTRGVEMSGRVVDTLGGPVAGAAVSLAPETPSRSWRRTGSEVTSAEDGHFTLSDVAPGAYRLTADKEGYARARSEAPIEVGESPVAGLEIRLTTGATLRGRILGLDLDELAQVDLRAGRQAGEVDFEGAYSISHLAPGEHRIRAEVPGAGKQVQETVEVDEGVSELILDLDFTKGFVLTGEVVNGGEPLPGATITLRGTSTSASSRGQTDAQGRFRLTGLAAGIYRLQVRGIDTGLEHNEEIEVLADDDVRIEIGTGRLAGRVLERAGEEGIEGVQLSLERVDGGTGFSGQRATSDSRGAFSFAAVPEGRFKVSANKAGYSAAESAVEMRGGESIEDLDLILSPSGRLVFAVLDATGVPPRRITAMVLDGAGNRLAAGSYDALEGGRIELTTVPDGTWELLVYAGSSAVHRSQVAVPGDAGRLQLEAGGRLEVEVPDLADGRVVANLRLVGADGRPHRAYHWGEVAAEHPLRNGRATLANLAAGPWTLQVTAADGRSWSGSATVSAGETAPVTLR